MAIGRIDDRATCCTPPIKLSVYKLNRAAFVANLYHYDIYFTRASFTFEVLLVPPTKRHSIAPDTKITKWQMVQTLGLSGDGLPSLDGSDIQAIRAKYNLSQSVLASVLNIGLGAVRQWEQGTRTPGGAALKLLHLLDKKGLEFLL